MWRDLEFSPWMEPMSLDDGIDVLREKGPITAGEMSKITGLATGSVTALIDRLEKMGYVHREKDPDDRRKVIIVPDVQRKKSSRLLLLI